MIQPIQKHLLIELRSAYKHLKPTEERFGTSKTQGIVKAIASDITPDMLEDIGAEELKVGDMVYFGKYEDTAPYKVDGIDHIVIKLKEVGGRSDAE